MLRPRVIPCLLLQQGALVKTRRFREPRYIGDPLNAVRIFNEKEVDELLVVDIDASRTGQTPDVSLIAQLAAECRMPLCYGGGVTSEAQFEQLVSLGVEKVAVSAAAVADPGLVARAAERVGSQSVVAVIDVVRRAADGRPEVVTHNATRRPGLDPVEWAAQLQMLGAGEIVLNSVDRDGVGGGYDLSLIDEIRRVVTVPLTAMGGCGALDDIATLVRRYGLIGAAAGSLFVFKGKFRAVLINYPSRQKRDALIAPVGADATSPPALPATRRQPRDGWTLGIDASNLLQGGGRTHLVEVLAAADPPASGFGRVVVWGRESTLSLLEDRPWLQRVPVPDLEGGLVRRAFWQRWRLSSAAARDGCDLLFVPGGSYAGGFRPVVTMCQNMLPFDQAELRRYGLSPTSLRLQSLRHVQAQTFLRADGVIFLSHDAQGRVQSAMGAGARRSAIIPHGIRPDFFMPPRPQRSIDMCTTAQPFRLLYVSTVDVYKHPWHVVEAVHLLRQQTQWPLTLDLVGPAFAPSLRRLDAAIERYDPTRSWVKYHGPIPHRRLPILHGAVDAAVFASTCENLPNIVMEYMAAGLPVVSADHPAQRGLLGDSACYFDPEQPTSIAGQLGALIRDRDQRAAMAAAAFTAAHEYSWLRCSELTFGFLREILLERRV